MKSLEELMAIKQKMQDKVAVRNAANDSVRVVVGMATCGIAAGARPVLNAFVEAVNGSCNESFRHPDGMYRALPV